MDSIKHAAEIIKESDALLITAGAGIGVDSGLPDFRGSQGFWRAYPVIKKLGISFEQMANPHWFEHNPKLAWAFYGHRLNLYRNTIAHKGFYILLYIAIRFNNNYFVVTSNVDGQFQKADFDEQKIQEIHGSIHYLQCTKPCSSDIWSAEQTNIVIDEQKFEALGQLPRCKNCKEIARPNILMFDDWNWSSYRTDSQRNRFYSWLNEQDSNNRKIVIIEIGAGIAVPSIRLLSEQIVSNYRAKLIRINPTDTNVPKTETVIPLGALQALREIKKLL